MRWCRVTTSSAFVACSATSARARGTTGMRLRVSIVASLAVVAAACSPRAHPLTGVPAPRRVPVAEQAPVHRKIVFKWDYYQPELRIRGEGVARVAPPDSARLDFFVNGQGTAHALRIGDQIRLQSGQDAMRDFLPPPAL